MNHLLIIEDCPFACEGYKNLLKQEQVFKTKFQLTFANDCDTAIKQIKNGNYDIVILDIQLPVSKNEKYLCGEDLGLLIRNTQPNTKIIVITNISDALRITSIINELKPEGFIIKAKSDPKDLIDAINHILNNKIYYCKAIKKYIASTNMHTMIDDLDRQILHHLSMGEKTKDLCKLIPLSHRAIEDRKRKLTALLDIDNSFNLIKEAKRIGYI
ncbi:response regulator [Hyunsoonleella sp. 2307UL5-6]|uniref:response regulator n=1 Tax=Hyunsoonleella sp. 2307UL5-6 TaxID=3384768 RepID=UPI0039BD2978